MAIPKFEEDVEIISKMGDYPSSDDNLSTEGFKAKFDEAAIKFKNYINNTLIPNLDMIVDVSALLNAAIDKTLTLAGKSAEAKATGDALNTKFNKTGGKLTGNIDMGTNKITNVGDPTDNGDAVNMGYADTKMSLELLWENASPSSDFEAQEIELDLTPYSYVFVEFVSADSPVIARKDFNFYATRINVTNTEANSVVIELRRRVIGLSDTKITFSACNGSNYTATGGKFGETTAQNGACKPFRIYGMKGVD